MLLEQGANGVREDGLVRSSGFEKGHEFFDFAPKELRIRTGGGSETAEGAAACLKVKTAFGTGPGENGGSRFVRVIFAEAQDVLLVRGGESGKFADFPHRSQKDQG